MLSSLSFIPPKNRSSTRKPPWYLISLLTLCAPCARRWWKIEIRFVLVVIKTNQILASLTSYIFFSDLSVNCRRVTKRIFYDKDAQCGFSPGEESTWKAQNIDKKKVCFWWYSGLTFDSGLLSLEDSKVRIDVPAKVVQTSSFESRGQIENGVSGGKLRHCNQCLV